MADHSNIEWTDATWNPVTGCTKISPGCAHCYAETFSERFRGVRGHPYEQGFDLKLWPERIEISRRQLCHRMCGSACPWRATNTAGESHTCNEFRPIFASYLSSHYSD